MPSLLIRPALIEFFSTLAKFAYVHDIVYLMLTKHSSNRNCLWFKLLSKCSDWSVSSCVPSGTHTSIVVAVDHDGGAAIQVHVGLPPISDIVASPPGLEDKVTLHLPTRTIL